MNGNMNFIGDDKALYGYKNCSTERDLDNACLWMTQKELRLTEIKSNHLFLHERYLQIKNNPF